MAARLLALDEEFQRDVATLREDRLAPNSRPHVFVIAAFAALKFSEKPSFQSGVLSTCTQLAGVPN